MITTIRLFYRNIRIKLITLFGYKKFYFSYDSTFITCQVTDINDVPKNVSPLKVMVQMGNGYLLLFATPELPEDFVPQHQYYMKRVCVAYDRGGLVDGTYVYLKPEDAVMLRLIMD